MTHQPNSRPWLDAVSASEMPAISHPTVEQHIDDALVRQLAKAAFDRQGFPITWESLPDDLTFERRLGYEQALIVFREAGIDLGIVAALADGRVQALIEAATHAASVFVRYGDLHAAKPDMVKATANYLEGACLHKALAEIKGAKP